jgi:hypothetical protein
VHLYQLPFLDPLFVCLFVCFCFNKRIEEKNYTDNNNTDVGLSTWQVANGERETHKQDEDE